MKFESSFLNSAQLAHDCHFSVRFSIVAWEYQDESKYSLIAMFESKKQECVSQNNCELIKESATLRDLVNADVKWRNKQRDTVGGKFLFAPTFTKSTNNVVV